MDTGHPFPGRTRCYWALLSADLHFIYLDPVLASHLDAQADLLVGKSLLSFVHPDEQASAKSDLSSFLDSRTLHGSVTRVRFSRLSRIRRQLGHASSPSPWPYSERMSVDTHYMPVDIVINWAAEGLVLCFIHATADLDSASDNDKYNKSSWSDWCGTTFMPPEQIQVLWNRLLRFVPPYQPYSPSFVGTSGYDNTRVFQILANQPGRPLLLSWPPDQGGGLTGRDFARLVENAEMDLGPQKNNDAKTSCTRRYRATQLMSPALGEVESVFIPHGSVIFACHKVESAIRSTSGAVPMSFSASSSTFASGPPTSTSGTGFSNMQHQHHPAYAYGSISPGSGYPPPAPSYYDPHASYALPPTYQPAYGHAYPSLTQSQTLHAQSQSNTPQTQQLSPYATTPSPRWPQQHQQQPQSPVYPTSALSQSQHWSVSGPSSSPTVSLPHSQSSYPHPSSYSSPLSPLTPHHPPSISIPPSASSSSSASVGISPQGHLRSESGNHAGAGAGSASATTTPVSPRGQVWHTPPAPSGNELGGGSGDGSVNVYRTGSGSARSSAYTTASSGAGAYQPQRTDSNTPQAGGGGGEARGGLNMNIAGMNMGAGPSMGMSLGHPLLPGASSLLSAAAALGSGSVHNGLGGSGGLGSTGTGMSLNTGMGVGDRTFVQTIIPSAKRKVSPSDGDQLWRRTSGHTSAGVVGSGKGGAGVKMEGGGRNMASRPVGVMQCSSCGATTSPEWRKGPSGKKELCNACGLRYARSRAKREGTATGTRKKKTDKLQLQMQLQTQQYQPHKERNKAEHVSSPFVSSDIITVKKPRISEENENSSQRTSSASPARRPFEQYSPGQGHSQVQSSGYEKRHTPLASVSTASGSPDYASAMLRRSFGSGQGSEYGTTENGHTHGHPHYVSLTTDGPPGTGSSAEGSGTGSRSVLTPTPTPSPPASASITSPGNGAAGGDSGIGMPLGLGAGDSLALPLPVQRRGDNFGHIPAQGQRQEYGFVHYNPAQHQRREESQSHSTSAPGQLLYPQDPSPREYNRDREGSNDRDRSQTQLPPLAYMDRNLSSMHGVGEIKSEEGSLNSHANAREPLTPLSAESPSSTGPGSSREGNGRSGNGVVIGMGGRA